MSQTVKAPKHGSHLISYQIIERGEGKFSFAEGKHGVSGILITDNAAVYGSVPLIFPGEKSLGTGELKVEIMSLDSSRDYNFNHYRIKGEIPGLEGDDYTLTVKAYSPPEPGEERGRVDWLKNTPIKKGIFVPTDLSFLTFRAGKDAELFELEIYHGPTLVARTPKLALPGYKLELARKALPEEVKGLEYRPQELVEIKATGPALFGTSGVRGKIGYVLTAETVKATSQATVEYILKEGIKGPMIVGGDTRFLSEDFAKTAAEVFAGNAEVFRGDGYDGPVVIFMDTDGKPFVPTPLMTFAIRKFKATGGVTMTASHNFSEDNGYKSLRGVYGGLAPQAVTDSLQERANALLKHNPTIKMLSFDRGLEMGLIEKRDLRPAYFEEHLMQLVDFDIIRQSKPVVAVDFLYGTAIGFLDKALLEDLAGCRIAKRFHDWRDRDFGGRRPDCEDPDNIRDMIDYVAATPEVDVGLSVDSDSDRFGVVSKKGLVNANHILAMLFYYLHRVKGEQGKVCRTIVTTHLLDVMAQKWGVELVEIPRIGFKWIGDLMNDEGESFMLAGEESSGLSRGNFPEKDGSLADLLVLEMMCKIGQLEKEAGKRDRPIKPLHEILEELQAEFGPWHCHRLDLYGVRRKQKIMDFFRKEYQPRPDADLTIAGLKVHKTNVTAPVFDAAGQPIVDGVKYFLEPHDPEEGVIAGITTHIRESGNEPVIRIYTQHRTDRNKLEEIEQTIAKLIREIDEG